MILTLPKKQLQGVERAKNNNIYKRRKPIKVDTLKFLEILDDVNKEELSAKEGAKKLGISIDKFYREKKKLQK